jgi:hypothetical protein
MASVVAEAFLSAFAEVLVEKIISTEFVNYFWSKNLDIPLFGKAKINIVESSSCVLNDAEEKQIINTSVKQ